MIANASIRTGQIMPLFIQVIDRTHLNALFFNHNLSMVHHNASRVFLCLCMSLLAEVGQIFVEGHTNFRNFCLILKCNFSNFLGEINYRLCRRTSTIRDNSQNTLSNFSFIKHNLTFKGKRLEFKRF